jgi:hypothetical protein
VPPDCRQRSGLRAAAGGKRPQRRPSPARYVTVTRLRQSTPRIDLLLDPGRTLLIEAAFVSLPLKVGETAQQPPAVRPKLEVGKLALGLAPARKQFVRGAF